MEIIMRFLIRSIGSSAWLAATASIVLATAPVANAQSQPKPATEATKAANKAIADYLDFSDRTDFENADRGFIAKPENLTIVDDKGVVAWDLEQYKSYIGDDKAAPDTVNPSLWRNAQLNVKYGLYKVSDRIFQVRGYDLSNITFIEGDTGWIVFDPLISVETAKAAYDLVSENLGRKPVVAVVYSHSHVDHYGGVRGIVDEADVKAGKVQILAPEHFTEHAASENVIAGNAMSRRAVYMFGSLLPRNAQGGVNGGLGQTTSSGTSTLILPTREIKATGEELTVDGVKMVFQMTPGTEAPAEMNTYFPDFRAMWMAENSTNTLHNILTLRGAQVRDALMWANCLNQTIDLYGDKVDVKFQSHHWPMWETVKIKEYWKKQRDLYKYIHDQSVRMMNEGYIDTEIADMIKLPPELEKEWYNRGYYGTYRHNSRAVYQRYMGFYDANPSSLDKLPPEPAARKYLEYMGGAAAVLKKAKRDFDNGEYRWVAEALKHVVFAEPDNKNAKEFLADTYEQMGYQAESGPWRSVYLQGAHELRNGVPDLPVANAASPDVIRAMDPEMLFDYLGIRLNGQRAAGKNITLNLDFTDIQKQYALTVENATLNYADEWADKADVKLTLTKSLLDDIQLKKTTVKEAIDEGKLQIDGNEKAFVEFLGLLDNFPFWFNIVTP
ncbi:alkyl/aryl-sulfatase [Ensifer sp. SL37]|uniref:alkyl/aryl-sulfatase n=1 Tax=Ensifer sp. SL37 TaxID=2995137 RepID=UPI0022769FB6|nr:alkyl sulfatase dimerization domain-containing protein [Ensifer sp. SL37]MCY1740520.1 MBL fold metallo-hydrolase [Ensifer sp. SL37]